MLISKYINTSVRFIYLVSLYQNMDKDEITQFKDKINLIISQKESFSKKIDQLCDLFQTEAMPYNYSGNDRILSKMQNEVNSIIERLVEIELQNLTKQELTMLENDIENIPFLKEGFKSSIRLKIALKKIKK